MLGRRSPPREDLSVTLVESMLSRASAHAGVEVPVRKGRAVADRAVWFCACVSEDEAAPTWLIYETAKGGLGWRRVDDCDGDIPDLVDAKELFGDHVAPGQVAEWLQGTDPERLFDVQGADLIALRDLQRRIRDLQEGN